ncbi:MAG: hypothetical protein ACHREM_23675 [Polyangiales bacterium]
MIPVIDLENFAPLKDEPPIELTPSVVADDQLGEIVMRFAATVSTRDLSEINAMIDHVQSQVDDAGSESLIRALALLEGRSEELLTAVAQWAFFEGVRSAGGTS